MIYALLPLIIIYGIVISVFIVTENGLEMFGKLFTYIAALAVSLCLSLVFHNFFTSALLNWIFNTPVSIIILRFFYKLYERKIKL